MKKLLILFILISLLSFLSTYKALYFHFWRDDWADLWMALYKPIYFINQGAAIHLHPGSAIEKLLGVYVFRFNPFFWQLFGIILKILTSLSVALMMLGITNSKRIAFISGVIYASFFPGLESFIWVSAHTSAIFILFFCLGFYFWTSGLEKWNLKKNIVAIMFLVIAFLITPARASPIMLLLPFWDMLSVLSQFRFNFIKKIIFRNLLLLFILWVVGIWINSKYHNLEGKSLTNTINTILINYEVVGSFFNSLGNLLSGWYYKAGEFSSITTASNPPFIIGLLYSFVVFGLFLLFLIRRTKRLQILLFLFSWIIISFIPSWMFGNGLVYTASHRYFTISAVALVGIIAYFLSDVNKRLRSLLILIFLVVNIIACNMYLSDLYRYRSSSIIDSIWNKIDKDVPKEEKDSIFVYLGKKPMLENILTWSGSVPYGIKRDLRNLEDFPIVTNDKELIINLICEENINRPSVDVWVTQKSKIDINHLHVWQLNDDGTVINISDYVQNEIKSQLPCVL